MQRLAHAVKALKLKRIHIFGHLKDRCDGMGVVGRKLRVDAVGHRQELARVGDIGNVGGGFRGEDREAVDAKHLRGLDLGVP